MNTDNYTYFIYLLCIFIPLTSHRDQHRQKSQHSCKQKPHQPYPVSLTGWAGWRYTGEKYAAVYLCRYCVYIRMIHTSPGAGLTAHVLIRALMTSLSQLLAPRHPKPRHTHVQACPGEDIWRDLRLSGLEAHAGAGLQAGFVMPWDTHAGAVCAWRSAPCGRDPSWSS